MNAEGRLIRSSFLAIATGKTMNIRPSTTAYTLRHSALLLCLVLSFSSVACDSDNSNIRPPDSGNTKADTGKTPDKPDTTQPDTQPQQPEDTGVAFTPGFMHGNWKATSTEDGEVVGYFALIQNEGFQDISGTFLAGPALYEGMVDGAPGDVAQGSTFDGTTLTLKWNPTTQATELMTITAQKDGDDKFNGNMVATLNPELNMDLTFQRETD